MVGAQGHMGETTEEGETHAAFAADTALFDNFIILHVQSSPSMQNPTPNVPVL